MKTHEQFMAQANKKHNNKYKYPEKFKGSHIKMRIICPIHGNFYQTPNTHLIGNKGKGCGCKKCADNNNKSNKLSMLEAEKNFWKKVKSIPGNKYIYLHDSIYTGAHKKNKDLLS